MRNINFRIKSVLIVGFFLLINPVSSSTKDGKPNILWIFIEDASCHISCYGEKAIQTPNIDALAVEGVRFENAFVTAPVCSPSRSALNRLVSVRVSTKQTVRIPFVLMVFSPLFTQDSSPFP